MQELPEETKVSSWRAWHSLPCSCVWQLLGANCDPTNEESPILIEMVVISASSGGNSSRPLKRIY